MCRKACWDAAAKHAPLPLLLLKRVCVFLPLPFLSLTRSLRAAAAAAMRAQSPQMHACSISVAFWCLSCLFVLPHTWTTAP